jgi:hypothetical protein
MHFAENFYYYERNSADERFFCSAAPRPRLFSKYQKSSIADTINVGVNLAPDLASARTPALTLTLTLTLTLALTLTLTLTLP